LPRTIKIIQASVNLGQYAATVRVQRRLNLPDREARSAPNAQIMATRSPQSSPDLLARDRKLSCRLQSLSASDPEYWSFRSNAARQHAHAFFQYPAMMVPQMQARLLADIIAIDPTVTKVYDPFVGSGTVLTEAMLLGLHFHGCDINPLAILLSRVKAGPFFIAAINARWERIKARMHEDGRCHVESTFPGWQKWFKKSVAIRLSRIVRAIRTDRDLWCRRFFWVAIAETVRVCSNSRTSTFKLHLRPQSELTLRDVDPLIKFQAVVERNLDRVRRKVELLGEGGNLVQGFYTGKVTIELSDAAADAGRVSEADRADLLITSPPYGDNQTTVPYGQHSFLPLQWIDWQDIDPELDPSLLANTHALDTRSLGGSRANALQEVEATIEKSSSLRRTLEALASEPRDRRVRVAAFWRDIDQTLTPLLSSLRPDAYMVWVVGNRRVGNRIVPMHDILSELIMARGGLPVAVLERHIHSKRMANRNDFAKTMSSERILVMRKGGQ
jgi:hypothetical protein